jgi:hypothetical protein
LVDTAPFVYRDLVNKGLRNKNKNKTKYMNKKEKFLTMGLLAVALFSQMFLFSVAYTNASFGETEVPVHQYFSPSSISATFDKDLNIIADNLRWSITVAAQQAKGPVLAFLGLDNYSYGQPRYTSLASSQELGSQPEVLGAYQVNPAYSQ